MWLSLSICKWTILTQLLPCAPAARPEGGLRKTCNNRGGHKCSGNETRELASKLVVKKKKKKKRHLNK
jgi:hypothetical protein